MRLWPGPGRARAGPGLRRTVAHGYLMPRAEPECYRDSATVAYPVGSESAGGLGARLGLTTDYRDSSR
jgi:hypothetical protein